MRKSLSILAVFLMMNSVSFGQIQVKQLEVYSITEYIDGYVIKGIDVDKADTINIISTKEDLGKLTKYRKVLVGKKYLFKLRNTITTMAAIPNDFAMRIRRTVVWKSGDGVNNIPSYSINMKGLWIKEK